MKLVSLNFKFVFFIVKRTYKVLQFWNVVLYFIFTKHIQHDNE
jgi:hypothetical protein